MMGDESRKNVFIIGAGASKEFNLPTGNELKTQISSLLDIRYGDWGRELISGDGNIVSALRALAAEFNHNEINKLQEEAWKIRDNMPLAPSIDNFLHTHTDNEKLVSVGKIAITSAILKAENSSLLAFTQNDNRPFLDFDKIKDSWIVRFFQILVAQKSYDDFLAAIKTIKFISFNYDRCIQHFLINAASNYFQLSNEKIHHLQSELEIIYPYGNVGNYRFQDTFNCNFGREIGGNALLIASRSLRTFTEGAKDDRLDKIYESISSADIVLFLGFGFHPLNMKLLSNGFKYHVHRVLGTSLGLSENSRKQVLNDISEMFEINQTHPDNNYYLINSTCSNLVHEFERYLIG